MKKKFGTLIIAGVLSCTVALSFAACGGRIAEFEMPEGGFDTDKPVTISFSHTMGQNLRGVLQQYAEEFRALYPNITIENLDEPRDSSKYEELYDMLSKQIVADTQPNIAYCYSDHVAGYNQAGAVLALDDFLPGGQYADMEVERADGTTEKLGLTEEQVSQFIPGYYNEGKEFADGKMYTMPFSKSTEVLFYNKTAFEKNGWEVPDTWTEMEALCAKIKATEGYTDSIPLGYDSESNWFITMCEQYRSPYTSATGEKYLFDNETNRGFVQWFSDWYQKGYVTTQQLNNNTYTSNLFTDQKTYMCIGSTAGASYQQATENQGEFAFEVGIAPIPQVCHYLPEDAGEADYDADYQPKVISQGPSVCIFKNNDPQQVLASWLFIKFLITNVHFQADFSITSGYVPVLNLETMKTDPVFAEHLDNADGKGNLTALSSKVCMEQENAYFTSPAFVGSAEARVEVGNLLQAVFANPGDLDKLFKQAVEMCKQNG